MNIESMTIKEIVDGLNEGKFTSVEITKAYIERIEKYDTEIGAFITVLKDDALKQAEESDRRRKEGKEIGYLEGVPVAIKDNICTKGTLTTCASRMLEDFVPPYDATVIEKLKEAGCVIIGKTNMDEFAMGGSTETSYMKKTRNPWDTNKVPGGSSGGSIAAVSASFVPFALGSDTGGSVRQPASYCGTVGLKPTYGLVSRYGLIAYASSLDQIGVAAKTVEDVAMSLNVIAGHDEKDTTSRKHEKEDYTTYLNKDIKDMKIAVPKEFLGEGVNPEVKEKIENTISMLKDMGCTVDEISMSTSQHAIAVYYIVACAEASSNLARYDGIRFGYKTSNYETLDEMYLNSRSEGFGEEVKRRIMLGTYVLSSGYYDAYYKKAQQVRTLIIKEYEEVFKNYDVIITPTAPTTAFEFGKCSENPLEMYLNDICTVPVNVAGVPAMSLNVGFDNNNMPIGLQIIADKFKEGNIIKLGDKIEKELKLNNIPNMEVK